MVILSIAGAVAALIWGYLLVGRGRFWRIRNLIVRPVGVPAAPRRVAVVIPARNEAAVIAGSIASLLESADDSLHMFLVDDASTDGTAQVARQTAASMGKLGSLTILHGQPLPPGWSGKLWAVSQGIAAAHDLAPDFLLLSDADLSTLRPAFHLWSPLRSEVTT